MPAKSPSSGCLFCTMRTWFKRLKARLFLKFPWLVGGFSYKRYWDARYRVGGTSGAGSFGELASYKAEVINEFLKTHPVDSVIEFGCGDGNQLKMIDYPKYLGLDVAASAVERCRAMFTGDPAKSFSVYNPGRLGEENRPRADLVVCLDVLYHVVDEDDYVSTLNDIFSCARKHVILYTNLDERPSDDEHIRLRSTKTYLSRHTDFQIEVELENIHKDTAAMFIFLKRTKA